jgi:hypothetical protein
MHPDRRLVLMDRIIPFLAALVGLVALAAAVVVYQQAMTQDRVLGEEMARLRQEIVVLNQRNQSLSTRIDQSGDDSAGQALLALQERVDALEAAGAPLAAPAPLDMGQQAPIDPNLPSEDCIPQGTRFMVSLGDSFPICQSNVVVTASAISAELVALDNGASLVTGTPAPMPGGACTASLLSADNAGFAELRVDCR